MAPEERDQHEETRRQDAPGPAPSTGDTAEELRYEGPITIDDDEDDEFLDEGSGSGKVFLTAAVLSALVLVIIATAMWMRNGTGKNVEARDLAAMEPPPAVTEEPAPQAPPAATGEVDYRALPDTAPAGRTAGTDIAAGAPPAEEKPAAAPVEVPPVPRPRPREARQVEAAAPPREAPAPAPTLAEIRRRVMAGRVAAAARAGEAWARTRPSGEWTLQVLLACRPDTVRRAFRKVIDPDLVVLPTRLRGRDCYRVCWKTFASEAAARGAVDRVPPYFRRDNRPLPRTWGQVLP